jgi:hypothetical protein
MACFGGKMIFSRLAIGISIACILFGVFSLALGIYAGMGFMEPEEVARYVGKSPGQAIDRGALMMRFAVVLGTLAEINFSIRKAVEAAE